MEFRTLLFLVLVLHFIHHGTILLDSYLNNSSDEFTDVGNSIVGSLSELKIGRNKKFIEVGHRQLPSASENMRKKVLEKASENLIHQSAELHHDNDVFVDRVRIQQQVNHIHENMEWSTKRIVAQNEAAATRLQHSLQRLVKINETMHSMWNVIESMLSDVEQKLGRINDYLENRSEQLNGLYQTSFHVVYLLGAMMVAAFLQAPFITRITIIGIAPLNFMAFLTHRNMEHCLGFGSITGLILFISGVHFLMVNRHRISITKNDMCDFVLTNAAFKQLFAALQPIIVCKDPIIKKWQVAASWLEKSNLLGKTKHSHSDAETFSFPGEDLNNVANNVTTEYEPDHLDMPENRADYPNSDTVIYETYDSDANKGISIVESPHCDLSSKKFQEDSPMDSASKSFDSMKQKSSIKTLKNKASDANNDGAVQKRCEIEPTKQAPLSSVNQDMSSDLPIEGPDLRARKSLAEFTNWAKKSPSPLQDDSNSVTASLVKQNDNSANSHQLIQRHPVVQVNPNPNTTNPVAQHTAVQPNQNATAIQSNVSTIRSSRAASPAYSRRCVMELGGTLCRTKPDNDSFDDLHRPLCNVLSPTKSDSSRSAARSDSLDSGQWVKLCGATTQKGTPCRNRPSYGGPRCSLHCDTMTNSLKRLPSLTDKDSFDDLPRLVFNVPSPIRSDSRRSATRSDSFDSGQWIQLCGATTQKGTPCRNRPSYGGTRCWLH